MMTSTQPTGPRQQPIPKYISFRVEDPALARAFKSWLASQGYQHASFFNHVMRKTLEEAGVLTQAGQEADRDGA